MLDKRLPRLFVMFLSLCVWAIPASAQDGPSMDQVNAVARQLFCPVCENTPLDVCPTEACQQWRDVIRTKLAEGESEQQILDYFAEMYGDSVLAEPPVRQLAAWLLPAAIILVAVGALAYWIRGWVRAERIPSVPTTQDLALDGSDPWVARLEKELAEWE